MQIGGVTAARRNAGIEEETVVERTGRGLPIREGSRKTLVLPNSVRDWP